LKLLLKYIKPQSGTVILALFLASVSQIFSMLDPWVGRNIIDLYLLRFSDFTGSDFIYGVMGWLLLGISFAMVSRIAKNLQDYFINVAMQQIGASLFMDGIKHTMELPFEVFEDRRSGETLNVLQKVRTDTEKLMTMAVGLLYASVVGVCVVFIASFMVHWLIAPAFLVAMLVVGISSSFLSKKIKTVQKQIVAETGALAGTTTESLRNIELVKSLGLIGQEIRRIRSNTLKILGLELMKVKKVRTLGFVQGTTVNLMRNLLLLFLSWMVFTSRITPGMYIQFLFYTFFIFNPLQELGTFIQVWREAQVSLGRYRELLETPVEPEPKHPQVLGAIEKIEFKDVTFRHRSSSRLALDQINITLKKGETIAVVGPSGSGKSTLVKLLVGLYKPETGHLFYNDIPSEEIRLSELRLKLGVVSQESQLFSGTLRENLQFVNPGATDEQMQTALRKSAAHSLLNRCENGLDTTIGEGGIKVSGGEKQRISIARALLRNPDLMVFDEATSALDSLTEKEITQTIREISHQKDRINVMIAHRLSTIMHADCIYVLEKGMVTEKGTHDELLTSKGLYYAMWRQQIGESEV
jgi:ATP-binding cassette subfamily B protein